MKQRLEIKETTKTDNETLLLEQMKHLTKLIEELKSKPSSLDGNREKKSEIKALKFTNKELKEMPRLKDFKIRIKNNKYYEIRFRKYGYNVSFSSTNFETAKQKAFAWLSAFEDQIKPNVHFTVLSKSESDLFSVNKRIVFKTFADNYLYNVKKNMVKPITFKTYKNYYEGYLLPTFGNMTLASIKPITVQDYLNKINKKTPRACEDIKMLLNNIFNYAVNNGVIDRNPVKAVYIQKHERKKGNALTPEQEKEFVQKIKGTSCEHVFLKMLYSGVRSCEINEITENISDNTLTIKNGKLKSYQKNLYRTIPIFPKYKTTLSKPISKKYNLNDLREEFKKFCPDNTLKDLRHTFTTRARECGIDNEVVAVWTGHSLGNITSSVYTHFSMEFMQKEAKKFIY